VYFKSHELAPFERLLNSEGSSEIISLGYELGESGIPTDITTAGMVQIDDVPVQTIRLVPDTTTVLDQSIIPEDLTTKLPFYRAVIQIGRRI
jgi:hypothetical protein